MSNLEERSYQSVKKPVLRFLSAHPVDRQKLERGVTELLEVLDDGGRFEAFAERLGREEGVLLSKSIVRGERRFDIRFAEEVVEAVFEGR